MYGRYETVSLSEFAELIRSGKQAATISESRANDAFKTVRNRLRKYPATKIIEQCIRILNSPDAASERMMMRYPPWLMLVLLKWTLIYGDFECSQLGEISPTGFEKLIDRLHDYGGQARLPQDASMWFLVFHNHAFQQFWFLRGHHYTRLARQYLMFADAEESLSDAFLKQIGLRIDHFLELALVLLVAVYKQAASRIQKEFFGRLESSYPPGTIDSFLNSVSLNIHQARQFLQNLQAKGVPSRYHEYYEEPALKRFPLLREASVFQPYSRHLLYYSLDTFVYDVLKAADPQMFMKRFGKKIFERYVKKALDYADWHYQTEEELKKRFGTSLKLVDFVIEYQNIRVFLEAKGAEIGDLGKVSQDPVVVKDKVKDSLLKAVQQAYSTAKVMAEISPAQEGQTAQNGNYLLVVSFKDFYLGNGRDIYDFIARDEIDRIDGKELIPIDHIYVLSIDEFDIMAEAFRGRPEDMIKCLEKAVRADKDPKNKRFVFEQHLQVQLDSTQFPAYLMEAQNLLKKRIGQRLGENSNCLA